LVSPVASAFLEKMAVGSRFYTRQRFGNTIQFYIPLYLTNSCVNQCVYCGFNCKNHFTRTILREEQILQEIKAIKTLGNFQHILLVTGENPRLAGADYIERAVRIAKEYFASISIEVQPLSEAEYRQLSLAGVNAVYCYQETYREDHYQRYHPKGIKSNYRWRLESFDRMGKAGIHKIGLGFLTGLEDWRTEAVCMMLHLRYLQKQYWQTRYSISFPRMRPHAGESFQPNVLMSDKELAQLIFACRLFDHDIEMTLSTREEQHFRDHIFPLGITSLSAGSKTDPGGYAVFKKETPQFSINDNRTPEEILKVVKMKGYEVVWKDWDLCLQ